MREGWDQFFLRLAYTFASRSTCDRRHVGCVIVRKKHVISTGYNGSLPSLPHCDDVGHLFLEGRQGCQRTSHAEASALAQAARYGHSVEGCTAYVTTLPCLVCMKLLIMAGIERIVYSEVYRETYSIDLAKEAGIKIEHITFEAAKIC